MIESAISTAISGERPLERRAAEAREQHDARERAGKERGAEVVDRMLDALRPRVEDGADHEEADRADRQVDVEDPAPRQVVDEEAAEQRADDRREAEDRAEEPLVPAAVARRDDVADDRDRRREQAARAETLERAERDQLGHVLRDPAERRADEEDHDRDLQRHLAPVEVAELPVERPGDRRREQIRGHDPREVLEPAEVADDRRQARSTRSSGRATRAERRGSARRRSGGRAAPAAAAACSRPQWYQLRALLGRLEDHVGDREIEHCELERREERRADVPISRRGALERGA